jgi:DNA-binding LytR/AlgR family response regulator
MAQAGSGEGYLRWINASVGQNLRLITVDEMVYFQADNKYTRVVTADGEALIRKPLKELVDELDPTSSGRSIAPRMSTWPPLPASPATSAAACC